MSINFVQETLWKDMSTYVLIQIVEKSITLLYSKDKQKYTIGPRKKELERSSYHSYSLFLGLRGSTYMKLYERNGTKSLISLP